MDRLAAWESTVQAKRVRAWTGDGFGNAGARLLDCAQPPGLVADNTDCNDGNADVNPNGQDVCGEDRNCDGQMTDAAPVVSDCPINLTLGLDADCQLTAPAAAALVQVVDDCTAVENLI